MEGFSLQMCSLLGPAEGGEGGDRGRALRAEEEVHMEAETRVDFEEVV